MRLPAVRPTRTEAQRRPTLVPRGSSPARHRPASAPGPGPPLAVPAAPAPRASPVPRGGSGRSQPRQHRAVDVQADSGEHGQRVVAARRRHHLADGRAQDAAVHRVPASGGGAGSSGYSSAGSANRVNSALPQVRFTVSASVATSTASAGRLQGDLGQRPGPERSRCPALPPPIDLRGRGDLIIEAGEGEAGPGLRAEARTAPGPPAGWAGPGPPRPAPQPARPDRP